MTNGSTGELSRSGLWSTIRDALRGTQEDLTDAPIGRAILLLAVPMVVEMAMESVFAVADVFWVSRLGADAVATVGLTESMVTCVYAVAMGLSVATAATVARRIGEKNRDRAALTAVQGVILGVIVALPIGLAGGMYAPRLLEWMGASKSVLQTGSGFTRIMLGGNATILLLFLINAIFRGAGDAAIAMRVLWFANIINIVLGPCFIFGLGPFPQLGVTGAAVATNIGRGSGVLLQLWTLWRARGRIEIRREHLRFDPGIVLGLFRLSLNGTFQSLVSTTSWVGLVRILSTFGSAALAGYTIGIRVIVFALLPSWGLSNAAATLVGQNLGARRPERAEQSVWRAGLYNCIFLGLVGLLFVAGADAVVRLFTDDPAVQRSGVDCLRIVSAGFVFYAWGMVMTQAFNGAGDTVTPTVINLFCFWLWEVPIAYVLAVVLGVGPRGVFAAIALAFSTLAVVSVLVFRGGRWKARRV